MKVGFIGLGIMGKPMALNLVKAGHRLVVYDLLRERMTDLAAAGADLGLSPRDVAARSEATITMLPDGPEVETAVLGPEGALAGAQPGSVIADMSSISPLVAQKVGEACGGRIGGHSHGLSQRQNPNDLMIAHTR